jgi:uroporphyrinogen-III decarboxylase
MSGGLPVQTGWIGGDPEVVLEETDEHVITRDRRGRRMRLCKGVATIPLPLDHPVQTMEDWQAIKHHYAYTDERIGKDLKQAAQQHLEAGRVVTVNIPGGFDEPRQLMGEEALCMAYYDQPELIHDMLDTIGDTAFKVLELVSGEVTIDQLSVHEDMAGKSGPLAGPRQVEQFIRPYYLRIWELLCSRGARLFKQDSDGDMRTIVPQLMDAGINFMYPNEPAAEMDIVKLREEYGQRLALEGGIDKHVIRQSRESINAELEYKIPPMVRSGGCVLGLDHRIPNSTPLANYRFYIQRAWKIIEREERALST